jgi:hypothetical protein
MKRGAGSDFWTRIYLTFHAAAHSLVPGEAEYLFSAYSIFTVFSPEHK